MHKVTTRVSWSTQACRYTQNFLSSDGSIVWHVAPNAGSQDGNSPDYDLADSVARQIVVQCNHTTRASANHGSMGIPPDRSEVHTTRGWRRHAVKLTLDDKGKKRCRGYRHTFVARIRNSITLHSQVLRNTSAMPHHAATAFHRAQLARLTVVVIDRASDFSIQILVQTISPAFCEIHIDWHKLQKWSLRRLQTT